MIYPDKALTVEEVQTAKRELLARADHLWSQGKTKQCLLVRELAFKMGAVAIAMMATDTSMMGPEWPE